MLSKIFGRKSDADTCPADVIRMRDGRLLTIRFFGHASIAFEYEGRHIYVDPVMKYADYGHLPKADAILVTHPYYDHFDMEAVEALRKEDTAILCDRTTAESFEGDCYTMLPGAAAHPLEGVRVDAVAAYNTSPEQLQFHPRQSEFCGYLLTFADGESGMRVYVSGDTEPTDEMRALHDIDIAFVCVNQPYTMTPEQAVEAVEAIRPGIVYPYHFGEVDHPTDVEALAARLAPLAEVRLRPLA